MLANNLVSKLSKQIVLYFVHFIQLVDKIDVHIRINLDIFAHYNNMRIQEMKFLELPTITSSFIKYNANFSSWSNFSWVDHLLYRESCVTFIKFKHPMSV